MSASINPEFQQEQIQQEPQHQPPAQSPAPPQASTDELMALTQRLIQEANARADAEARRAAEFQQQLQQRQAPISTPETQQAQFYQTPVDAIVNPVRAAMEQVVAPLNQDMLALKREREYVNLKQQMIAATQYFPHMRVPAVIQLMDVHYQGLPQININTLQFLYNQIVGQLFSQNPGLFVQQAPPPPVPQPNNNQQIPPHLRSSPPAPNTQPNGNAIQLTENERAMARHYGMTDEQYYTEMHRAPGDVARRQS